LDIQNFDKELALESAPARADVDRISAELAGMGVDRQRNIEQQLQKILDLNIQIDNLSPTRAVSPPMQSLKPQGMGRVKLMLIFIFLGAVIGFVLVLGLEMTERAKERIAGLEAKS
jgi:LPS O-antigen subunit length determinant protein (WzzB/FepE family)